MGLLLVRGRVVVAAVAATMLERIQRFQSSAARWPLHCDVINGVTELYGQCNAIQGGMAESMVQGEHHTNHKSMVLTLTRQNPECMASTVHTPVLSLD
jgi:hypothetical protein